MARYRTKPCEIDAFQMTVETRNDNRDWPEWLNKAWNMERGVSGALYIDDDDPDRQRLCIGTLEGPLKVSWGDFIIRGTIGEIYPCKPEVFNKKYEIV